MTQADWKAWYTDSGFTGGGQKLGHPSDRTKICGGGAKSPLWKKMVANIMNVKVDVVENEKALPWEAPYWRPWAAKSTRM